MRGALAAAAHPESALSGGDGGLYAYLLDVECARLIGGGGGLWDGGFFFPLDRTSLLFTEPQWGASVMALPFWLVCDNPVRAVWTATIAFLVAAWFGMRVFGRAVGGTRAAGWLAALLFGVSAPLFGVIQRPFFWGLFLVPLIAALVHRALQAATAAATHTHTHTHTRDMCARAVLIGLLASLLIWSSCHLTVMGGTFIAVMAWWSWRTAGSPRIPRAAAGVALAPPLLSALLIFIPMGSALHGNGFSRPATAQSSKATQPGSLFTTPEWSRFSRALDDRGVVASDEAETHGGNAPVTWAVVLLGVIAMCLRFRPSLTARGVGLTAASSAVLLGLVYLVVSATAPGVVVDWWRTAAACAAVGVLAGLFAGPARAALRTPAGVCGVLVLLFALLAIGPLTPLDDGRVFATPALLLARLPGFSAIRASSRYTVFVAAALASMAAFLIAAIPRARVRGIAFAIVAAAVVADLAQPDWFAPASFASEPVRWEGRAVDRFLRDQTAPGAVLELPINADHGREAIAMVCRLKHGRPVVNGWAGFEPARHGQSWNRATNQLLTTGSIDSAEVASLRSLGARYWVIHVDMLAPALRGRLGDGLGPLRRVATFDDGMTILYEDPAPAGRGD